MTTDKPSPPAKRTMPKSPGRPRKAAPAKAQPLGPLSDAELSAAARGRRAAPKAQTLPSGQVVAIDEAPALDPLGILEHNRLVTVRPANDGPYCAVCLVIPPVSVASDDEGRALGRVTTAYGHTVCAVCLPWAHPDLNVMYRSAAQVRSRGVATSVGMYQRWLAKR